MIVIAWLATLFTLAVLGAYALITVLLVRQSRSEVLATRVRALERDGAKQRALLAQALAEVDARLESASRDRDPAASTSARAADVSASVPPSSGSAAAVSAAAPAPAPRTAAMHSSAAPRVEPEHGAVGEPRAVTCGAPERLPRRAPDAVRTADETAPAPPTRTDVGWEQRFGIKGAALVGGASLALAGLLFVQYSIERGWLGPHARCALAAASGIAALFSSSSLRSRGFLAGADSLAGAGVTLILGATWAAYSLYDLLPFPLALLAMAATTASCGLLAVRRSSRTLAWFGLLGGFATPLLLSLGARTPIGLFLYLLGLDIAVLALVRQCAWPRLADVAAIATQLVFASWIALHFEPRDASFALLFTGAIAVVFAASRAWGSASAASWVGSIAPFVFAVYFAGRAELGAHVYPIAALLLVLTTTAAWLAQRHDSARLQLAASVGAGATLITWLASSLRGASLAYEAAGAAACLGLAHVAFAELARRRSGRAWTADLAALALAPFAGALLFGAVRGQSAPLTPWLVASAGLALGWVRLTGWGARARWSLGAQLLPFCVYALWRSLGSGATAPWTVGWGDTALVVALAASASLVAWCSPAPAARREASTGVIVLCALALLERTTVSASSVPNLMALLATTWTCAALGVLAARRAQSWVGYAVISGAAWMLTLHILVLGRVVAGGELGLVLTTAALGLLLVAAPSRDANSPRVSRPALRASALVLVAWEFAARRSWRDSPWGAWHEFAALLDLLAGVALAARLSDRRVARDETGRRSAASTGFVWLCVASAFLGARTVDRIDASTHWSLAAAVFVAATAWIARAARHTGVRWIVIAAGVGTGAALLKVVVEILQRGALLERTGWPVWHRLSCLVGAPALALVAAAWFSRERDKDLEAPRWPSLPWLSSALSLCAVLAMFLWLNIEVVNLFSDGPQYAFEWLRRPPRDVALSVAWTCFALGLLIVGMRFERSGLRWTSLAFFLATIGKVFLYDLGELRGLHRVGSLVGLAFALLAVSVLYQRLVFRARPLARSAAVVPQP